MNNHTGLICKVLCPWRYMFLVSAVKTSFLNLIYHGAGVVVHLLLKLSMPHWMHNFTTRRRCSAVFLIITIEVYRSAKSNYFLPTLLPRQGCSSFREAFFAFFLGNVIWSLASIWKMSWVAHPSIQVISSKSFLVKKSNNSLLKEVLEIKV